MMKEEQRLEESRQRKVHWKRWGPYLSERQWGTVRQDYSPGGIAWDYFPHDQARSRAYRWGEDGIGGISDRHQFICFALALWNGKDPILKERLFGLTGNQGNHGEDVKEYYYYLDSTPTLALSVVVILAVTGLALAGGKLHKGGGKAKTFTGEIFDSQRAMNNSHAQMEKMKGMGDDSKMCTLKEATKTIHVEKIEAAS